MAERSTIDELREAGFAVTTDPAATQVVVVSFDRTFDYEKLNAAFQAVRYHGATIVATNPDPYCPTPDGGLPDCAAMLAAIEASTGAKAEAIVGKPSIHMAQALLDRLGLPAARRRADRRPAPDRRRHGSVAGHDRRAHPDRSDAASTASTARP